MPVLPPDTKLDLIAFPTGCRNAARPPAGSTEEATGQDVAILRRISFR